MKTTGPAEIENSENSGFTAPAAAPGQAESRRGKAALDALLTEATEPPEWKDLYEKLLDERVERDGMIAPKWDWRKALYIAWSVVPKAKRQPPTEDELAVLLNLKNTRTIRQWKQKFPEIEERIAVLPKHLLLTHLADVYEAMVTVAKMPVPAAHQDRRLFLELTGDYAPKSNLQHTGSNGESLVIQLVQRED